MTTVHPIMLHNIKSLQKVLEFHCCCHRPIDPSDRRVGYALDMGVRRELGVGEVLWGKTGEVDSTCKKKIKRSLTGSLSK
jgi:hypothetical protein